MLAASGLAVAGCMDVVNFLLLHSSVWHYGPPAYAVVVYICTHTAVDKHGPKCRTCRFDFSGAQCDGYVSGRFPLEEEEEEKRQFTTVNVVNAVMIISSIPAG